MVMNLSKSFKIAVCCVMIAVMLSGCMNSVHLKDLLVVEGLGVETQCDKVNLIIQTLKLGAAAGDETPQGNRTYNTEGNGATIVDAISGFSKSVSKKLFFGQNKLIVFSRDIAESDFKEKLDYFLRSSDSRVDVAVCISDKGAKEIIDSKENDAGIPCENIVYLLKNGQDAGLSAYVTIGDLLNMSTDKTSDVYLPVVEMNEKGDSTQTKGLGLFSKEKMAYVTNDEETLGFNLISDKVKICTIEFEDEELGDISLKVSESKVKKHIEIVDGNIVFYVDIKAQLMIDEIEKGIVTNLDEKKLKKICSDADRKMEQLCTAAFSACQENNSDSLRVGEYLAKDSPKSYDKLSDEWDKYFQTVRFSVHADTELKKISDNTQLG